MNPLDGQLISLVEEQAVERSEELESLYACIEQLSEMDKALVLLYLDGNDHARISEVLGITVTNAATRLSRIKQRLRKAFVERVGGRTRSGSDAD